MMSTSLLSSDTSNSNNSNSTIAEHLKWRKPRNHNHSININHHHNSRTPNSDPQMPSIIQSTGCKSTISSLLLSTFTNNNNNHENTITNNNNPRNNNNNNNNNNNANNNGIKKSFKNSSLRGFGCTTQPEVAVPAAVIRSSADWNEQEKKKNNKKINNNKNGYKKKKKIQQLQGVLMEDSSSSSSTVVGVQDFWCADSSAADSVDCVRPLSSRNKIDLDKLHQRERALYANRQRVNAEQFAALDLDSAFELPPFGPDVFEARYYHHLRNRSPDGLAEILMFQNGLLTSRRAGGLDRYRDLRLDVDNMTYEELLELGERIGHVSTGLGEDQIGRCLRKTKLSVLTELPSQSHISNDLEGKCSICQEEYDAEEELGKLECGHAYHLSCIEQWLVRKNACPVCKAEASSI